MTFASRIPDYGSVSVVGLAKNAGKTETLNHVLEELRWCHATLALTSIGTDGESVDQVTHTRKPEITVGQGMVFVTTETYYRQRRLTAEVLDVSQEHTAMGRLVTARALTPGKVIVSGPATTAGLRALIARMGALGVRTTLVDGALSRLSLGSPAITDAMVLATGAAVSRTIDGVVNRTAYVCGLIALEAVTTELAGALSTIERGVWGMDTSLTPRYTGIPSGLSVMADKDRLFSQGRTLFTPGAVGDRFLDTLSVACAKAPVELIVGDFTRIFAAEESYRRYVRRGGTIRVLRRPELLAVTVNPLSAEGYRLDSHTLRQRLRDRLATVAGMEKIEVCDVRDRNAATLRQDVKNAT